MVMEKEVRVVLAACYQAWGVGCGGGGGGEAAAYQCQVVGHEV